MNQNGSISAIMHPVGFMYNKNEIVNVQANDMHLGNHKLDITACVRLVYTNLVENVRHRIGKDIIRTKLTYGSKFLRYVAFTLKIPRL